MKTFKTIDEQINILKDRDLVIDLKMQMKYFLKTRYMKYIPFWA